MLIRSKSLFKHSLIALGVSVALTACSSGGGSDSTASSKGGAVQSINLDSVHLSNGKTANWGESQVFVSGQKLNADQLKQLKAVLSATPNSVENGYTVKGNNFTRIAVKENDKNTVLAYAGTPVNVKLNELSGKMLYIGNGIINVASSNDGINVFEHKIEPLKLNADVDFDNKTITFTLIDTEEKTPDRVDLFVDNIVPGTIKQDGKDITFTASKKANKDIDENTVVAGVSISGNISINQKIQGKFAGPQAQELVGHFQSKTIANTLAEKDNISNKTKLIVDTDGVFHATKQ